MNKSLHSLNDKDFYDIFTDLFYQRLNIFPEGYAEEIESSGLMKFLSKYYLELRGGNTERAARLLNRYFNIARNIGISPETIEKAAIASAVKVDDLEQLVASIIPGFLYRLLSEQNIESGGWHYLEIDDSVLTTNAWTTATCLHALANSVETTLTYDDKLLEKAMRKGAECLYELGSYEGGWSDICLGEKAYNNRMMLHDSAYVSRVLINIGSLTKMHHLSDIIYRFIEMVIRDSVLNNIEKKMDMVGVCHFIRLLNAVPNPKEYIICGKAVLEIRKELCVWLLKQQKAEGFWPGQLGYSEQVSTALAIDALVGAEFQKDWVIIVKACRWLINRLIYIQDSWCWVEKDEFGVFQKSLHTTSIVLSTLSNCIPFNEFAKVETAILWLTSEMGKERWHRLDETYALCALFDFLKNFGIKELVRYNQELCIREEKWSLLKE